MPGTVPGVKWKDKAQHVANLLVYLPYYLRNSM